MKHWHSTNTIQVILAPYASLVRVSFKNDEDKKEECGVNFIEDLG